MATTNALRPTLDLKVPELLAPTPVASTAGVHVARGRMHSSYEPASPGELSMLIISSASVHYLYCTPDDAYIQIAASGIAGTFGAGACSVFHPFGSSGTATAGGATTITTNLTIPRRLDGYKIRITGGAGAGQEKTIASNTMGANAIITVDSAWSTNPDATSTYVLLVGSFFFWNPGTASTFGFRRFTLDTMAWSSALNAAPSGMTAFGTDGRLVTTASAIAGALVSGTATSATSTTLTVGGKSWTTNQWANSQVRITGGLGVGQVRTISSNTGTVLTVSAAWTTTPDGTSTYVIEGNDDHVYLLGNAAVTLYRYSISGNAWTVLSPGVARGGNAGAGMSADLIKPQDPLWRDENNWRAGRFIYSLRGGGSAVLDAYDIALNTWAAVTYAPNTETFTTGSSCAYDSDERLYVQKDATNRWFVIDVVRNCAHGWMTVPLTQGAALAGDRTWIDTYVDGATTLQWVYHWMNTSSTAYRTLVIA